MADGGAPTVATFERLAREPALAPVRETTRRRDRGRDPRHQPPLAWRIHHWAGLKLSLFLTFVCLTGTLAVFAHEIDWLLTPAMRVAPQPGPHASWGAQAAAVQGAVPDAKITDLRAPIDPWFATTATVETAPDDLAYVYVDPWTAEVQGVGGWFNVHRFLRNTHRHLMLPVTWGLPIVCSTALLLLTSMVAGLFAYKKFWRGFRRVPRLRAGRQGEARRFTGDLHRFTALWTLWFLALMIVTGVWYLVEWGGGAAPSLPRPTERMAVAQPVGPELDRLIDRARAEHPALDVKGVRYAGEGGIMVEGQADAILVRDRANGVWLDPASGQTRLVLQGQELSWHQRISEAADPLHFGTWGGLASKVVWFLFGAAITGLCVTGVMIYSLRLRRADTEHGGLARAFAGMGLWVYPAAGLILMSLALTPFAAAGWIS